MRIKLNGTILESNNELVVEQWKKKGYKEFRGKAQKEPPENGKPDESGQEPPESEPGKQ